MPRAEAVTNSPRQKHLLRIRYGLSAPIRPVETGAPWGLCTNAVRLALGHRSECGGYTAPCPSQAPDPEHARSQTPRRPRHPRRRQPAQGPAGPAGGYTTQPARRHGGRSRPSRSGDQGGVRCPDGGPGAHPRQARCPGGPRGRDGALDLGIPGVGGQDARRLTPAPGSRGEPLRLAQPGPGGDTGAGCDGGGPPGRGVASPVHRWTAGDGGKGEQGPGPRGPAHWPLSVPRRAGDHQPGAGGPA